MDFTIDLYTPFSPAVAREVFFMSRKFKFAPHVYGFYLSIDMSESGIGEHLDDSRIAQADALILSGQVDVATAMNTYWSAAQPIWIFIVRKEVL